ncbi:glycosyltransferase family 4 protein [Synechococcus sp. GFB01]|uniref:glycosyltransferase family 4 protein n=1 Tax=Synechococcus sp. GFB01 TaxID=1662190 RepID=UPI00128C3844|nr:glycosyltransferase [Synechococcus sp. GFB01]
MKIIILPLNSAGPWGGSEILWSELAKIWSRQHHQVAVGIQAWQPMPTPIRNLENHGVTLRCYPAAPSRIQRATDYLLRLRRVPSVVHPLEKWVAWLNPDLLVFSADGFGGLAGIKLAAKLQIPYAYIIQANSESWWPSDRQRDEMNAAIDAASGAFCFVGERNRDLLEIQLGRRIPEARIVRNPHGALGLKPITWPILSNDVAFKLRLAYVGRMEPIAKGQDLLLQALAMPQWRDRLWHLSLYGSGHGVEGLKAIADMLGIGARISILGSYSSLEQVWQSNHALVITSRYEGLPLALAEAMWLGRPAVVTDVADCALLIRDGVDGFVAEAPTVMHVSQALERLWNQRQHLEVMGRCAAQRVRTFLPADPVKAASEQILSLIPQHHLND